MVKAATGALLSTLEIDRGPGCLFIDKLKIF